MALHRVSSLPILCNRRKPDRQYDSKGLGPLQERYLELREHRQDKIKGEIKMEILKPISQKSVPVARARRNNGYDDLLYKIQSLPNGKSLPVLNSTLYLYVSQLEEPSCREIVELCALRESLLSISRASFGNLIRALNIFKMYGDLSSPPCQCEHGYLYIMIDPQLVSSSDLVDLERLGFVPDEGGHSFVSSMYGSAS